MLSVELNALMKELPAVYLHYLSFGLFFNCNCSCIACVARTIRFPENFLTCSSKGAHSWLYLIFMYFKQNPPKIHLNFYFFKRFKKLSLEQCNNYCN